MLAVTIEQPLIPAPAPALTLLLLLVATEGGVATLATAAAVEVAPLSVVTQLPLMLGAAGVAGGGVVVVVSVAGGVVVVVTTAVVVVVVICVDGSWLLLLLMSLPSNVVDGLRDITIVG